MARYIWQGSLWPSFKWNSERLLHPLGEARKAQGKILGLAEFFELETQADVITEEAVTTAAIEGEKLDRATVRSSVARRLGLPSAGLPPTQRHIEGLVDMLIDATRNHADALTAERLKGWQAALFPTGYSGITRIITGDWRGSEEPMRVVSGPIGKETVHYEAPPAASVNSMMGEFLEWFQTPQTDLDGLVRAAIAHFWFVSIHPFEDGNGRIARTITDMALAQDEKTDCRMYSMSAQIEVERNDYYEVLERNQKGNGDITEWVVWFLECLRRAIQRSGVEVQKATEKARMWQELAFLDLNERQKKAINRLYESGDGGFEGGLTTRKYMGMTHTSRTTAKREIADLIAKGLLIKNPGEGRSVSYRLSWREGASPTTHPGAR
jgi:Fic family protein